MIMKRSVRNQVAIPKKLIEKAGLTERDRFFSIEYSEGCFILKPVVFQERSAEGEERAGAMTASQAEGGHSMRGAKHEVAR